MVIAFLNLCIGKRYENETFVDCFLLKIHMYFFSQRVHTYDCKFMHILQYKNVKVGNAQEMAQSIRTSHSNVSFAMQPQFSCFFSVQYPWPHFRANEKFGDTKLTNLP